MRLEGDRGRKPVLGAHAGRCQCTMSAPPRWSSRYRSGIARRRASLLIILDFISDDGDGLCLHNFHHVCFGPTVLEILIAVQVLWLPKHVEFRAQIEH